MGVVVEKQSEIIIKRSGRIYGRIGKQYRPTEQQGKNNDEKIKEPTMNCPDANTLSEFIEGKLLDEKYADIFAHIAVCPDCKDYCRFAVESALNEKKGKNKSLINKIRNEIMEKTDELIKSKITDAIKEQWNRYVTR